MIDASPLPFSSLFLLTPLHVSNSKECILFFLYSSTSFNKFWVICGLKNQHLKQERKRSPWFVPSPGHLRIPEYPQKAQGWMDNNKKSLMTSSANHFQQFKNCKVVVFLVYILIREKNIWVWFQRRFAKHFSVCVRCCSFFFSSLIGSHTYLSVLF